MFNAELEKQTIKNALFHIHSKSKGINIQLAEGNFNTKNIGTIHTPFYTASITKMLTATAIGILKDNHQLNFNDKIHQYLPNLLIKNLHVLNGKDYSKAISIAHLLQHTSGLPDYFEEKTVDGSPNIMMQLFMDMDKNWNPKELIKFTKAKMSPLFIPGKGYHYTDTEYVLLGLIIENISGITLDQFFKKFIFKPLGMDHSYLNLKSTPIKKTSKMAEFYFREIEVSSFTSLSADWAGGGLVSTTQDLICFFEAFNNNLIVKESTRIEMQNWIDETMGFKYGWGLRKVLFKNLLGQNSSIELIGHNGSTASFLWYCSQLDIYLAGTLNQVEASKNSLMLVYKILNTIKNNQN